MIMLNIFRSKKKKKNGEEKEISLLVREAIEANKPGELQSLLSSIKARKMMAHVEGKVLSYGLDIAIRFGYIECVQELLKAGADPNGYGKYYPVGRAIQCECGLNILTLLLEHGADPNVDSESFNGYFGEPLNFAAYVGDLGCFRTLLLYGADPDYNCSDSDFLLKNANPRSLLEACLAMDYEVPYVKLLIDFGANMYSPFIEEKLFRVKNKAAEFLATERAYPRSLMSQCRLTIRRQLRKNGKTHLIDQLEIPSELLRYLQHQEVQYGEEEHLQVSRVAMLIKGSKFPIIPATC